IEPDTLTLRVQDAGNRRQVVEWRWTATPAGGIFSRKDPVSGPVAVDPNLINPDLEANLFGFDEVDLSAAAALGRAALDPAARAARGGVTRMDIRRSLAILPTPTSGPVRWTISVRSPRESAEVVADARGTIVAARLAGTTRAQMLNIFKQPQLVLDAVKAFRA